MQSKVVQIVPPPILRPKNVYTNFPPCISAHHVDKFGEVIPTGPKVIRPNMLNCAPIEFVLATIFLWAAPTF